MHNIFERISLGIYSSNLFDKFSILLDGEKGSNVTTRKKKLASGIQPVVKLDGTKCFITDVKMSSTQ
jgi:hypothetical protein